MQMTRLYMFSYWSLFLSNRLRVNLHHSMEFRKLMRPNQHPSWTFVKFRRVSLWNLNRDLHKKKRILKSHTSGICFGLTCMYTPKNLVKKNQFSSVVLWWQTDLTENRGRIRTFESQRQNYLLNSFKRKAWMQVSLWFSTRDHFLRICVWVIFEINL